MKSTNTELVARGYITNGMLKEYEGAKESELYDLLHSKNPGKQSIAVRLLSIRGHVLNSNFVDILIQMLKDKPKLYTKIEICKALELGNDTAFRKLLNELGKIGDNQYKKVPVKVSKKKSYPLPRDIVARTLGRMNCSCFDIMIQNLNTKDVLLKRELIDAIGYMISRNESLKTLDNLNSLLNCNELEKDGVARYKYITCLSNFKFDKSINYLEYITNKEDNKLFVGEAKRSLNIIKGEET